MQLPEPTLSDLHTSYGDYLPWKIYSLTTGIGGAFYEQSIGLIEIFAGLLLLFRKTATIGASVIIFVLTNIVLANFAYEIGEHVYSAYLLSIALFLLIYDLPRLYSVFVKRTFTLAAGFKPVFSATWIGSLRTGLKSAFIVFVIFYGIKTEAGLRRHNWPFPETSGLSNAHGFYDVSDFKINNKTIPYSQTDPIRWNNVVMEKWNTLSIKKNVAAAVDLSPVNLTLDSVRNFESAGNGGRHFFTYTLDTLARRIDLYNKNNPSENLDFHYTRPDNSTIILYGKNEQNDSLKIVLKKTARRYLLKEGRRKPIRIN